MIYLDNAATTFPKPPCLQKEITKCIKEYCGNPGRSGHFMSTKAAEKIYECRENISSLFGSDKPENVVFTLNTTYALNIAIKTLYTKNSHILISNMEHNSVLRPIFKLQQDKKIEVSIFNVLQPVNKILYELTQRIKENTKILIMTHTSNICGKVFPIREIGEFCKNHNIIFIVDAAQSAGTIEIDMQKCHIDALCAPAHKGLYGAQGLGFVIFGEHTPNRTFIEGGNGANSLLADMGETLPESFEAGTMATPLIAGLNGSLNWLKQIGVENINNHEKRLATMLYERLESLPDSLIYGPSRPETGILLYNHLKHSTDYIANELNKLQICIRGGYHCAPLAHKTLSSSKSGAIRFSFGYFNTKQEVDLVYKALKRI